MKNIRKEIKITILLLVLVLLMGCTTVVYCEQPNKVIGDSCCMDKNDNKICDGKEKTSVKTVEPKTDAKITANTTTKSTQTQKTTSPTTQKTEIKKTTTETKTEITELKKGKYDIQPGEPARYLEIKKMEIRRYSRDKGIIDKMSFIVRNVGAKAFSPTVVFTFDKGITSSGEGIIEQKYDFYELKPGEKIVEIRPMGVRFKEINTTKKITMQIYDRYVAPRADKETMEYQFNPWDVMESHEVDQWGKNRGDAYSIITE